MPRAKRLTRYSHRMLQLAKHHYAQPFALNFPDKKSATDFRLELYSLKEAIRQQAPDDPRFEYFMPTKISLEETEDKKLPWRLVIGSKLYSAVEDQLEKIFGPVYPSGPGVPTNSPLQPYQSPAEQAATMELARTLMKEEDKTTNFDDMISQRLAESKAKQQQTIQEVDGVTPAPTDAQVQEALARMYGGNKDE